MGRRRTGSRMTPGSSSAAVPMARASIFHSAPWLARLEAPCWHGANSRGRTATGRRSAGSSTTAGDAGECFPRLRMTRTATSSTRRPTGSRLPGTTSWRKPRRRTTSESFVGGEPQAVDTSSRPALPVLSGHDCVDARARVHGWSVRDRRSQLPAAQQVSNTAGVASDLHRIAG